MPLRSLERCCLTTWITHLASRYDSACIGACRDAELRVVGRPLQHAFQGEVRTRTSQFDLFSREPHFVTALLLLPAIETKLVLLNAPLADRLEPHRIGSERAVGVIDVAPMHLIGHFH